MWRAPSAPGQEVPPERLYLGKVKGYVRDNADPDNRGRVRCYVPQVMGPIDDANHWMGWAEANFPWLGGVNMLDCGPPLTKQQQVQAYGAEYLGVWLEFEGGNPDFPIWCGTWLIAPTPTDPNAQQSLATAGGQTGGDIIDNPPAGSKLADLNPPKPQVPTNEARFLVKNGRELIIGCAGGGYILLGPTGVHVVGLNVTLNGKLMLASLADEVVG